MKNTCTPRRNTLGIGVFALAASLTLQASANPFNDGITNSITADTFYSGTLYVGIQNPDNTLLIESNATVSATKLIVGQLTSSTNNTLSVMNDARLLVGDTTTNGLTTGGIVVGDSNGGTGVSIRNASTVNTDYMYIGFGTNDAGKVELLGDGTMLNVSSNAYVGYAGSTNNINIADGASLNINGDLHVGYDGGDQNTVNVQSGGSLYVNTTNNLIVVDNDNSINIGSGGTLQIGGDVETGTLEADLGIDLANNARLETGGALTLTDDKIDEQLNVILNNTLSTNTATWSSSSVTLIGDTTSNNSLTLTNGATGTASQILQVGSSTSSRNNTLVIGGEGTMFTALSDIMIGAQGRDNSLVVSDGGQAVINGDLYLGNNSTATGNEVLVGSNGVLTANSDVIIGDYGNKNAVSIQHGRVNVGGELILGSHSINNRYFQTGGTNTVAGSFIIGETAKATGTTGAVNGEDVPETTGNLALVEDGAILNIQQALIVGQEGGGSILTIRDGGIVNAYSDVIIGEDVADNYIYLQRDADSRFNVSGDLIVGKTGGSNRFAVYGGTAHIDGSLYLGSSTNQHDIKNFIYLETTNASLQVADTLYIGASNSVNTLDVVDGATVGTLNMLVGAYEGTSNNVVAVTGEGSQLYVTNSLVIGSATGTNNAVTIEDGGTLNVSQTGIAMAGTDNTLTIADGGSLKTGDWDYALLTDTATNILFESGATLHLSGSLSGTNMVEGGLGIVLDGAGAGWDTGTNEMFVGSATGGNALTITNGALAVTLTNLYIGFASEENEITVAGTGSTLDIGNNLFVGNISSNESGYNSLFVLDGGMVNVGQDMSLAHGALLDIDATSRVTVDGNYEQDVFSTLQIGISSNSTSPNLVVIGTAEFTNGTAIAILDDGISDDTNQVFNIIKAGAITVGGDTATASLLTNEVVFDTSAFLDFSVSISNGTAFSWIVLNDMIKHSINDVAGLEGQLLDIADQIDAMDLAGNDLAIAMRGILGDLQPEEIKAVFDNYYGEYASSAPAHNAINLGLQSSIEQLTLRADSTRARRGAATAFVNRNKPAGTAGPHLAGQELQGWITTYRTSGDRSASDGFNGYDASIGGFLVGMDLAVAENVLFGLAGGSGQSSVDQDNGAKTDTRTSYGSVYFSTGTESWFTDASFIYGASSIDTELGSTFDTQAEFDAASYAFYFGVGKEVSGDYLIVTPQASLLCNYYTQDSYTEEASNAVGREVDDFDTLYIRSSLGLSAGMYLSMGSLLVKPEIRVAWEHEFNADEEQLSYSLIGGTGSYNLSLQAPEEDILKVGIGASTTLGDYLQLRVDLDARQAGDYSDTTVVGSLRYQF